MRGSNFGTTQDKEGVQVDHRTGVQGRVGHFGQESASESILWNDISDTTIHNGMGYLRAQNTESREDSRASSLPSRIVLVSGLTEEVERDDLILYFGKYGVIENCVITKDSLNLECPGRAYITFMNIEDACSAVSAPQHFIYGKPCVVRYCSLQDVQPTGTNRIFVARIPAGVTQPEFRAYFGAFGTIKDAYMPKDSSKMGHRGIGFITYAHASSVERVMMCKHALGGNELAIDRANPKDKPSGGIAPSRLASSQPNLAMPGSWNNYIDISHRTASPADSAFSTPQGSLADAFLSRSGHSLASQQSLGSPYYSGRSQHMLRSSSNVGLPLPNVASNPYLMGGYTNSPTTQSTTNVMDPLSPAGASYVSSYSSSLNESASLLSGRYDASHHGSRGESLWMQGGSAHGGSMNGPISARAGPRIFVGKLARETTEMDLKNYFSQFGFVLDVYLPRDKTNKQEHRGFGFVTFETDAAIHRIQGIGNHTILGANIAIESAVPRTSVDETRVETESDGSRAELSSAETAQLNSGFEALLLSRDAP